MDGKPGLTNKQGNKKEERAVKQAYNNQTASRAKMILEMAMRNVPPRQRQTTPSPGPSKDKQKVQNQLVENSTVKKDMALNKPCSSLQKSRETVTSNQENDQNKGKIINNVGDEAEAQPGSSQTLKTSNLKGNQKQIETVDLTDDDDDVEIIESPDDDNEFAVLQVSNKDGLAIVMGVDDDGDQFLAIQRDGGECQFISMGVEDGDDDEEDGDDDEEDDDDDDDDDDDEDIKSVVHVEDDEYIKSVADDNLEDDDEKEKSVANEDVEDDDVEYLGTVLTRPCNGKRVRYARYLAPLMRACEIAWKELEKDKETNVPVNKEVPEETSHPVDLDVPEETSLPVDLDAPEETSLPVDLDAPEETSLAVDLDVREETSLPVDLDAPEDTSLPVDLDVPEETSLPVDLDVPEETSLPVDLDVPEETSLPVDIDAPEEKTIPEDNNRPKDQETKVPVDIDVPHEKSDLKINEVRCEGPAVRGDKRKSLFEIKDSAFGTFHGIGPSSTISQPDDGFDQKEARDKFENEAYTLLEEFFKYAFTSIVYKIGLQPKEGFEIQTHKYYGNVQVLRDDSSISYIEESSKNAVNFIRKGVLDGVVFHFNMLNRDNCPITQQRFVFRPFGYFSAEEMDITDTTRVLKTMDMIKLQLSHSLKAIFDHHLDEVKCPWFSQWAISIGIKQKFMDRLRANNINDLDAPFIGNPINDYFPYKKRPRLSQAAKNGYLKKIQKNPDGSISSTTVKNIIGRRRSDKFIYVEGRKEKTMSEFSPLPVLPELPQWEYYSSSSDNSEDEEFARSSKRSEDPKDKLRVIPVASQEVLPNLIISMCQINYNDTVEVDDAMMARAAMEEHLFQSSSDSE